MNSFSPFSGIRYNSLLVHTGDVVAPPYDVISESGRDALYERDEHNVIRLEFSRESDPYASAKQMFDEWMATDILHRDDTPAFYVYYQTFNPPSGQQVTRRGVIGALSVSAYSNGDVLPHEQTLPKAKQDRLQLLEATHTQFSPIFGLIDDEALIFDHTIDSASARAPLADVFETLASGETVRHTMWRLDDQPLVTRLEKLVASKKVFIADGHHRYETAVAFAASHPEFQEANRIMIYLANLRADGTVILPTHRILYGLASFNQFTFLALLEKQFDVKIFDSQKTAFDYFDSRADALTLIQFPEKPEWVVVSGFRFPVSGVADKDLPIPETGNLKPETSPSLLRTSVYRLHEEILKPLAGLTQSQIDAKSNLLYPHTPGELAQMTAERPYNAAFILKAVTADEMIAVTSEGAFMPQKSTYFYPKLLTGLVFYSLGL